MYARWGHYLTGAIWIGLLYYFNFVQAPAFAEMTDAVRADTLRLVSARAMAWRRWSAVATAGTGVLILVFQDPYDGDYLEYFGTPRGTAVAFGSVLALVMLANVWAVIHPCQQTVIRSAQRVAEGRARDPDAVRAAKRLARAERGNVVLGIPMLWFMAVAPHFADGITRFNYRPDRDYIGAAWVVFILALGIVELSALGQVGGYDSRANKLMFDRSSRTVIAGLVMWAFLWIGAFEIIMGQA
jgi:uncharacterized membrane protein